MMIDPIADCLTRLRNAARARKESIDIPRSKAKENILGILKREGLVHDVKTLREGSKEFFRVSLRYTEGRPVLQGIRRVSRPGRRIYRQAQDLEPVLNGLGFAIVSTSSGVITDIEARQKNVGGEVLCEVW